MDFASAMHLFLVSYRAIESSRNWLTVHDILQSWPRCQALLCNLQQGSTSAHGQDAAHSLRSLNRSEPDYDPSECVHASQPEFCCACCVPHSITTPSVLLQRRR